MKALSEHVYYQILECCGQGGMGIVYRARDRRLNRLVALKFLMGGEEPDGHTGSVQRFQREAEAIAGLNHPNIATIFEAGEWDGTPFLALEFLGGGTLKDKLGAGTLTYSEIAAYATQLSSGLAFAHSKGILHRDIKPANCMFNEHGALKLVDFGLAKSIDSAAITQAGSAVGTIAYMAPELLRGEPGAVRSDLYALGAVVYEMAAGQPLYDRRSIGNLVQSVLKGAAIPLAKRRPDLPAAFTAAVDRATSPRAEERFASVQEFASAILGAGSHKTELAASAPTVTLGATATAPYLHPKLRNYGAVALLLVAILLGAAYFLLRHRPGKAVATMVVLPFENFGGDPANQVLCDGLQETVSSVLSSADELRNDIVIVPTSEVRRSQIHTPSEAYKQFRASLVLAGSIRRTEQELQVTLDLIDASMLRQKNSRVLTIPVGETESLQRQLTESLGGMLGAGPLLSSGRNRGETTTNSTAYDHFLRGRGALEDRKYDAAADLLKKAVDADPTFTLARAKLAEAYLGLNNSTHDPKWLGMADAEVAKAENAGPAPAVLFSRALIYRATGRWQEAIRLFNQAVKSDPSGVEARRLLADTWDSAGQPQEAERVYRQAIALRPGYWPLYLNLGDFYSRHGRYSLAERAFLTGIGLAPESPLLYSNLGAMYFRMSRWADAGNAFEKSLSIRPTGQGYSNLCTVRFYEGKYADAAKQCESATRLVPANAINWGNLGDALWQLRDERQQARSAFEKAADLAKQQLAINENNPALRKNYALYLAKLGQNTDAIREARRAIEQAPSDSNVEFYAARVYAVAGDREAAFEALKRSVALGFSAREIRQEPDFDSLKQDPRYEQLPPEEKAK
jgi:eukaryotic-like serine/threonine-protein kinase